MLKRVLKRALAIILVSQILGGLFMPTQAFAFTASGTNNHGVKYFGDYSSIGDQIYVKPMKLLYLYSNSDSINAGYNQFFNGSSNNAYDVNGDNTIDTVSNVRDTITFRLFRRKGSDYVAKETVVWAVSNDFSDDELPGYDVNSKWHLLEPVQSSGEPPSTSNEIKTFSDVLINIDDKLGSQSYDSLFKDLNNLQNSAGATTADLSNINQRLAAVTFMRLNPTMFFKEGDGYSNDAPYDNRSNEYRWDSIDAITDSDYQELLVSSLGNKDDMTMTQYLIKMGIAKSNNDITDADIESKGKVHLKDYGYCIQNIGVFAVRPNIEHRGSNDTRKYIHKDNKVFLANEYAFYQIIKEVCNWWVNEMPTIEKTNGWQTDDSVKAKLTYLKIMDKAFSTMIPVIDKIYKQKNPDADDKSIEDMVVEADIEDMTIEDAFNVDESKYEAHEDHTSPVSQFYTINSAVGITSFDLDKIVSDKDVDLNQDQANQELQETQENSERVSGKDSFEVSNTQLYSQITVASSMYDCLLAIQKDYKKWAKSNTAASFSKYWEEKEKDKNSTFWKTNVEPFVASFNQDRNKAIIDVIANHYRDTYTAWYDTLMSAVAEERPYDIVQSWFNLDTSKITINGPGDDLKKIATSDADFIKKLKTSMDNTAKDSIEDLAEYEDKLVDYGVDETGNSTSFASVTFNKFIIEGLGYSTTYVPMRTNLYNADTLASYMNGSEETDFYKFYMDYGFMRKALYKDVSSSAVMDYYNAGNTFNGSLKLCTLRDLMEVKDGDIALYIDQNFYNADDACSLGNKIRENSADVHGRLYASLSEFLPIWQKSSTMIKYVNVLLGSVSDSTLRSAILASLQEHSLNDEIDVNDEDTLYLEFEDLQKKYNDSLKKSFKFDLSGFEDYDKFEEYVSKLAEANNVSSSSKFDDVVLKNKTNTSYDPAIRSYLADVKDTEYTNLSGSSNDFTIDLSNETILTDDNVDSIVLSSAQINQYMSGQVKYDEIVENEAEATELTNTYTANIGYTPLMSLSYISCLYRDVKNYTLANTVSTNIPVFMASDDMTTIKEANQWYRNTLLNFALVKNLRNNAQVDISYVTDLDNPLYMDIFGNIITESGIVVIPAASNATLHVASFRDYNYSLGLYTCYGTQYSVPADLEGAATVLDPMFTCDNNAGVWKPSAITMNVGSRSVRFDKLDTYDKDTQEAVKRAYMASVSQIENTRLNWPAYVNVINEVMRGAPIESIDKDKEGLIVNQTKSGLVAASKLESLEKSLKGQMSNTLLCIPDFSRMDNMEYWVALLIKLMIVATAAVVIIAVYRDGIQQTLGVRTFIKCMAAVALTFSCIVVVPSVFQLTYYAANKFLLGNEALRILMVNEEKRQGGSEIGISEIKSVESKGEFALQLDWITVPWYNQLENMLYSSTLDNLQQVKLEAYRQSPVYNNEDITMYNDGVYITTDTLFDSVGMDYTFNVDKDAEDRGLYLYANQPTQTASFYSPYYVFLRTITANVNEFNRYRSTVGDDIDVYEDKDKTAVERAYDLLNIGRSSESGNTEDGEAYSVNTIGAYNYTTKYMSGNRLKTVGLCQAYFNSKAFMENDEDILRLRQIYMADDMTASESDVNITEHTANNDPSVEHPDNFGEFLRETPDDDWQHNRLAQALCALEYTSGRSLLYSSGDRAEFRTSYWFDNNLLNYDDWAYNNLTQRLQDASLKPDDPNNSVVTSVEESRYNYLDKKLKNFDTKVAAMDSYARDFISDNKDMLNKVTDETFIKVMALAMSIKYNQLFGVPSANAVEIFNMDSDDILRLSIVPIDESIMAAPMSYSRYVYTFGGEPSIYVAAVLTIILWIGSFIKPLCTIIVFVSVFLSIFVFRVVLRRESANLWGYFVTTVLLCATNIMHALMLKVGVTLPNFGLPPMACLIFISVSQVAYLVVLGFVTGTALKDWTNLGASTYEKEANIIRGKFGNTSSDMLNGRVPHYDNNWDYYDKLVEQHRSRNYS